LLPVCYGFVAASRNIENRTRGIASVFFEGGTPDEKTEFPSLREAGGFALRPVCHWHTLKFSCRYPVMLIS